MSALARTDNVFLPLSEVCNGTVSLWIVRIWFFEFCHNISFWFLLQFKFFFSFVAIWVLSLSHDEFWVVSQFGPNLSWVLLLFEFLVFVTIWVFELCHSLSFWVWSQFKFLSCQILSLSYVTIWVFELSQFNLFQ